MILRTKLFGKQYEFPDLRILMGKANEEKSGDRLAGLAAETTAERAAAKLVLAEVPLWALYENPVLPPDQDEVTRVIFEGLNQTSYLEIKDWTVGQLREWLLSNETDGDQIKRIANGLTAEMISAVTKLMSNMDLVLAASKIRVVRHCVNTIGMSGTLSSRLQPNHPTDSPEGIRASIYEGLSFGSGDSVIGINPSDDSYASVSRLLDMTYDVIKTWEIPTQSCVLAHVTTQMRCMQSGSPVGLVFQSICGSQAGNESFGISVGMLDEAYQMAKKYCYPAGPNYMYFETGQGSALSANAHHGWDQLTLEARNYGLAKRYEPFQVNTVVGFIGPEYLYNTEQIHRAGLEDHFMGKLTGISMGCDVCYTNHARTDQNSAENLMVLLTAAGCNFFMGVPMADDSMLSYQSTSFHDTATVRNIFNLRPAPEFEAWMEAIGLMKNGKLTPKAGDPTFFLSR
ncbi:MAG: ethanolamine ammonia lyase large subunit [Chloroflexi bacterium HGW-Chloroflexi-2]|jgi:ethanolamine ammonia-lyase large subunit|nr:MAG: ethanolamine ammonia lyase large subunit [Chloroflexi bacterium HGW-Chloroflexi-2]